MRIPIGLMLILLVATAGPITSLYYFGTRSFMSEIRNSTAEYIRMVEKSNIDTIKSKCIGIKNSVEKILARYESEVSFSLTIAEEIFEGKIESYVNYEIFWAAPYFIKHINRTSVEEILNGTSQNEFYKDLNNSLSERGRESLLKLLEILNGTNLEVNESDPKTNNTIFDILETILQEGGIKLHKFLASIIETDYWEVLRNFTNRYSYVSNKYNITLFIKFLNLTLSAYPLNPLYNFKADFRIDLERSLWLISEENIFLYKASENFVARKIFDTSELENAFIVHNLSYYFLVQNKKIVISNDPFYVNKVVPGELEKYIRVSSYIGIAVYENRKYYISSETLSNDWKIITMDIEHSEEIKRIDATIRISHETYRRKFLFTVVGSIILVEAMALTIHYTESWRYKVKQKLIDFVKKKILR